MKGEMPEDVVTLIQGLIISAVVGAVTALILNLVFGLAR